MSKATSTSLRRSGLEKQRVAALLKRERVATFFNAGELDDHWCAISVEHPKVLVPLPAERLRLTAEVEVPAGDRGQRVRGPIGRAVPEGTKRERRSRAAFHEGPPDGGTGDRLPRGRGANLGCVA